MGLFKQAVISPSPSATTPRVAPPSSTAARDPIRRQNCLALPVLKKYVIRPVVFHSHDLGLVVPPPPLNLFLI